MPRFMLEGPRPCTIFCARIMYPNKFLLVSSSKRSRQLLCFVHGQDQKKENKNIQQRTLTEFHSHCPLCSKNALRKNLKVIRKWPILMKAVALFTVEFVNYNKIQRGCEIMLGRN